MTRICKLCILTSTKLRLLPYKGLGNNALNKKKTLINARVGQMMIIACLDFFVIKRTEFSYRSRSDLYFRPAEVHSALSILIGGHPLMG